MIEGQLQSTMANTAPQIAVKTLTIVSKTKNSISIRWNKATDAETPQSQLLYTVTWCVAPYRWDNNIRKIGERKYDNTSYTITGLAPNTTYDIIVYVRDANGSENTYAKATVTTLADSATTVSRPASSTVSRPVSSTVSRPTSSTISRPGSSTISRPRPSTGSRPSTSTTTATTPKPIVEQKTNVRIVKMDLPFDFKGNMNGVTVRKANANLGDGDLWSGKKQVQVDGIMNIANNIASIDINYTVWEDDFGPKNPKSDKLVLNGKLSQSLDGLFGGLTPTTTTDAHKTTKVTKTWRLITNTSNASYRGWYSKGSGQSYKYISYNDYPDYNNLHKKEWLPLDLIRVKLDGDGSELHGQGNIGIQGRVIVYFELTTVTTYTYHMTQATTMASGSLLKGSNSVMAAIPSNVRTVLGRGYDIKGNYADTSSVKLPVMDLDKANANKLIYEMTPGKMASRKFTGESKEELSSSYESELNVKVSAHGFGATFSNETKKTVKKETSFSQGRKYVSMSKVFKNKIYKVETTPSTAGVASLLTDQFLNDLNTKTADQIIKDYGTHVMLGMVLGARVTYSMSYVKSIEKMSTSQSFSNTTSIGYDSSPASGLVDKEKEKNKEEGKNTTEKSSTELAFNLLSGKDVSTERIKQVNELLKLTKNNSQPPTNNTGKSAAAQKASTAGSWGVSATVGIEVNTSESSTYENESMEESCTVIGGNTALENRICGDLNNINTWQESLNSGNTIYWADFEPGTLYPIYEFVPAGKKVTASALKEAWEKYFEGQDAEKECGRTEITKAFSCQGCDSTVYKINKDEDREVSTSDGKETGWKLYMEPVNLDGGDVAIAVQLTVGESGLNAGRTLLRLHEIVTMPKSTFPRIAIDSSKVTKASYEVEGSVFKKCHGLFNITYLVKDCPFLDTKSNTVYISIDDNGSNDSKHLIVKGTFKLPVIGYEK